MNTISRRFFLVFSAFFVFTGFSLSAYAQFDSIVFPVRELGNCRDLNACQAYCLQNMSVCLPYLEDNNLVTKEQADQIRAYFGISKTVSVLSKTSGQKTVPLSATISMASSGDVSGRQIIYVESDTATGVEIFASSAGGFAPIYIGRAGKSETGTFTYVWDSLTLTNGSYQIFARVSNGAQTVDSNKVSVSVSHASDTVSDTLPRVSAGDITTLSQELKRAESAMTEAQRALEKEAGAAITEYVEGLKKEALKKTDGGETVTWLEAKQKEILMATEEAARTRGTLSATSTLEKVLLSDLTEIRLEAEDLLGTKIATSTLDTALVKKITDAVRVSVTAEALARERVGEAITNDSDGDSVSDYDELYIFLTNPLNSDTDSDGTSDLDEITRGSNPTKSGTAPIVYEDILTQGTLVSEDVLSVTVVEAGEIETVGAEKSLKNIVFRGKSLPNSFVTLYIFSDPIVVITRTNQNGEWEYVFDRELSDGRHEVYVAVVGSAGKVVAKSNPLPFVKQAEAVSFGPNATYTERPGFFTPGYIILTVSLVGLAVVGVLILVGVSRRSRRASMTVNAIRPASQNLPPITPTATQTPPSATPSSNNPTTL